MSEPDLGENSLTDAPEPRPGSREDFLRYARDITLDPNTAHQHLYLSKGNRRVTAVGENQHYPRHPDRFVTHPLVLSSEGLTGRCYWEVELCTRYSIDIAVSYRDIKRKGPDSGFGFNNKSWDLRCDKNGYSFRFNRSTSEISAPVSPRIGVYLDHSAGTLCFYSVKDETMSLIHKVQTNFTQPLFAGVWNYYNHDSAHFLKLN